MGTFQEVVKTPKNKKFSRFGFTYQRVHGLIDTSPKLPIQGPFNPLIGSPSKVPQI